LSRNPYKTRALGAGTNDGKMRGLVRANPAAGQFDPNIFEQYGATKKRHNLFSRLTSFNDAKMAQIIIDAGTLFSAKYGCLDFPGSMV
jgi:hypothetical protein